MVCVYCESPTRVANSRSQLRSNKIWRRRICDSCGGIFTTFEEVDVTSSIAVSKNSSKSHLEPLSRDKLFISLYESCRRPTALKDAEALTATVITKSLKKLNGGILSQKSLEQTALETLKRFDRAAAAHYKAYFYND